MRPLARGMLRDLEVFADRSKRDSPWAQARVAHSIWPNGAGGADVRASWWVPQDGAWAVADYSMINVDTRINEINEYLLNSFHAGRGGQMALGDGAVRFLSERTEQATFIAMLSRDGGESVSPP